MKSPDVIAPPTPRGVSTTLDVSIALILLAAAIATVTGIAPTSGGPPPGDSADETAEVVATSTASVNYTLQYGVRPGDRAAMDGSGRNERADRVAEGTIAGLLAEAAVGNVVVDGVQVSHAVDDFERGVANATAPVVAVTESGVQIRSLWRPYPGAPVNGSYAVGTSPPPDADVYAATLTLPSGMPRARDRAIRASDDRGFEGVADVTATATVAGLFPPARLSLAMRADYPVSALARDRYRHFGELLDTEVHPSGSMSESEVARTNRRIAVILSDRFERDLEQTYNTPEAAARNVSVKSIRITVRTWSK